MPISTDCVDHGQKGNKQGYGKTYRGGRQMGIHRAVYEAAHGPIPPNHVVMHTCDNPRCINPKHLKTGTQKDNQQDALRKGRHTSQNVKYKVDEHDLIVMLGHGYSQRKIASELGVSQCCVQGAIRRLYGPEQS